MEQIFSELGEVPSKGGGQWMNFEPLTDGAKNRAASCEIPEGVGPLTDSSKKMLKLLVHRIMEPRQP